MSGGLTALKGVPRPYAWGSPTAIPELLGVPVTGEPVAELWFDEKLPFLLKVLAADKALSIQVHPNREQATRAYAEEETRGISRDAFHRNYRDANHKPELICALTEFDALCGFRPIAQTQRLLAALNVPELTAVRDALGQPDGLRAAFNLLLTLEDPDRLRLMAAVMPACQRLIDAGGEWELASRATVLAARHFPEDIGAVLALLLNAIRLAPGEAIFLPAGNVHAYLRGLGVEIMANSDNVLRCGLTPKHIDVAEVMRIADFSELRDPRCPSHEPSAGERVFTTTATDFELSILTLDAAGARQLTTSGAQILLCTAGDVGVSAGLNPVRLTPGRAVLVPAGVAAQLTGTGMVFRATTPPETPPPKLPAEPPN